MPKRNAALSTQIVCSVCEAGSNGAMPMRSRNTHGGPGFSVSWLAAHPVHGHRHLVVGPMTANLPDHLYRVRAAIGRVTAGSHPRDAQFGVASTIPMDRDDSLICRVVQVDQDLPIQDVSNALLGSRVGAWCVPDGGQVVGERYQ